MAGLAGIFHLRDRGAREPALSDIGDGQRTSANGVEGP
jgi:hypothetical protein